jgi:hypothetical protein
VLSAAGWLVGAYWLSQAATFTFPTSGPHTLRIQVREDGVMFDQIVLSPSTYYNASASCPVTCAWAHSVRERGLRPSTWHGRA